MQNWASPSARATGELWAGTACRVISHSYSLSPIPFFPTKLPSFPEGKEDPGKGNWSGHNQYYPVGPGLTRGEL